MPVRPAVEIIPAAWTGRSMPNLVPAPRTSNGSRAAAIWLAIVVATGYSSAGSILASIAMAPALWALGGSTAGIYGAASALLIAFMHRANIARLLAGTESVLPLFRPVKGRPPG